MQAKVTWNGRMSFTGSADTGFNVALDSSPSVGGDNTGFRPLELLAVGLAGCTAMDVIAILRKKRQEVTAFEVRAEIEQAEGHPHVFTHIHLTYVVTGREVDPKAVARAIELSTTKYCPASAMLGKTAEIVTSYEIVK